MGCAQCTALHITLATDSHHSKNYFLGLCCPNQYQYQGRQLTGRLYKHSTRPTSKRPIISVYWLLHFIVHSLYTMDYNKTILNLITSAQRGFARIVYLLIGSLNPVLSLFQLSTT